MVMGGMHMRLELLDRSVERLTAFYRARAEGEIGLILTGGFAPHEAGRMDPDSGVLDSRHAIDAHGHRQVCDAVHAAGSAIVLQILHAGRYAKIPGCVAPSSARARINRFAPHALTTAEVWDVVDQFARCAELACEAGYDGVEIMGAEGYLINEFLATRTNDREDEFGGSPENRFRLALEIVRAVRRSVGLARMVIFRISAIDLMEGGLSSAETTALARLVEAAGADVINTGVGWHESAVPTIAASVPRAAWAFAAQKVKDVVSVPVVASIRINTPDRAEAVLADGVADLVAMARPLLADPGFAAKVRAQRSDLICTCVACNQACLDAIFTDRPATCMVNPKAGREIEFLGRPPAVRKRVGVVGAGPAGLAFSVNAAERGHDVTLFEAADEVGGQLNMARQVPGKSEFNEALRYFRVRLSELGVTQKLGSAVSVDDLVAFGFDAVVVATGVMPRIPDIAGVDHPMVMTYADVLQRRREPGHRVAIIGAGGIGFDIAEYLVGDAAESLDPARFFEAWNVDTGEEPSGTTIGTRRRPADGRPRREVTILQRKNEALGRSLGKSTGWILRSRLVQAGVQSLGGVSYERIDDAGLHVTVAGESRVLEVDAVILCAGQNSDRRLFDALVRHDQSPVLIGGAHSAGELDAVAAIRMATQAAYDL
jgi:2,4-dienoyl-CoA reductase (NADPH2)